MNNTSEENFLNQYQPEEYPSVAVTVDVVAFIVNNGVLKVKLRERREHPFKEFFALPGSFIAPEESAEETVVRVVKEKAHLDIDAGRLQQLRTYTNPIRDPRMRIMSIAYVVILAHEEITEEDTWVPVKSVLEGRIPVAFDHANIIADAHERISNQMEYSGISLKFLPEEFTLTEVKDTYEAVWMTALPSAGNFRRKVLSTQDFVSPTDAKRQDGRGRPAQTYIAGSASLLQPAMLNPDKKSASKE